MISWAMAPLTGLKGRPETGPGGWELGLAPQIPGGRKWVILRDRLRGGPIRVAREDRFGSSPEMLADRLPLDARFPRDAPLGPASIVQGGNAVAEFHLNVLSPA